MSIRERIENNLTFAAGSLAIAITGATFGVTDFVYSQRHELVLQEHAIEIAALKAQVSSIERSLGGERHFDVRKFFITEQNVVAREQRYGQSEYYKDGRFFAYGPDEVFQYQKMTELELFAEIAGFDINLVPPALLEIAQRFPMHIWRHGDGLKVEGIDGLVKMLPHVAVQTAGISEIEDLMTQMGQPGSQLLGGGPSKNLSEEERGFLENYSVVFHGDAVGTFLAARLNTVLGVAVGSDRIKFSIRHLEKIGPVLYYQVVFELNDVVVEGVALDEYFIVQELFVLSDNQRIMLIQTFGPSRTPKFDEPHFDNINLWLNAFGFLAT